MTLNDREVDMRIGRYESSDAPIGTAITFLLIGLGAGAALGLLLAPKTGRQLRKDLRRSYDDALETVSDWTDEARDRFEEAVEKGSDFADELRAKAQPLTDLLRRS
jgi:gas vesicle protein